ncbi:calcium/sodium antiporter [Thermococcus sp. Bubb.Bath]|uniref:calcium/sodium antiporter n=1 Tax=Thermococcus sp. Bubb.Bath TaxID=1638242 RepID=UPI001438CBC3|nr:calcium/sodium antiporter [Thermococcus sp. Bubb.Bath]
MGVLVWSLSIVFGIILLVIFGDRLSDKIVEVAGKAGVSPLIISLVVISLATTLPEITTSTMASLTGAEGIALGNALGSIFANIALVLGLASVIKPLKAGSAAYENSLVMLGSLGFLMLLSVDGSLSRLDGALLLTAYALYLRWLYKKHFVVGVKGEEKHHVRAMPQDYALLLIYGGLMVIGARLVVYGGRNIAEALGVAEYVIGATIVAVGTSLPEMTNAIYGALRERGSISVGNIIGANIMNALVVLGLASLIRPIPTGASTLTIILVLMAMLPMIWELKRSGGLDRKIGVYFLVLYAVYLVLLFSGTEL